MKTTEMYEYSDTETQHNFLQSTFTDTTEHH